MDLTGREFGVLKVIKKCDTKREGEREWRWVCECSCPNHNIVEVIQHNLLNGHCTSCGCSNKNAVKNLTGRRFGYLEVIERDYNKLSDGSALWKCRCQCGNEVVVSAIQLRSAKDSISCGKCNYIDLDKDTIHDLYVVYMDMNRRCFDPSDQNYYRYGGRGIIACDEWKRNYNSTVPVTKQMGFVGFCNWSVSHGYKYGLTIDRIDNDYIYCPENCRWATMKVQSNNKCNNYNITYDGEAKTATERSEEIGIGSSALRRRINKGMSAEEAIETPSRVNVVSSSSGESHTFSEWESISGVNSGVLYARVITLGWPVDRALLTGATNPEIFNHVSPTSAYAFQNPSYVQPSTPPAVYYVDVFGRYYTPRRMGRSLDYFVRLIIFHFPPHPIPRPIQCIHIWIGWEAYPYFNFPFPSTLI